MLHFLTAAPEWVVRSVMSLASGTYEDAPWDSPFWAQSVIHVSEGDAFAVVTALSEYRFERFGKSKVVIADPTFAMAAAVIDRETGGSSPAPMYAR